MLQRLRRRQAGWMLLFVALIIKIAAGTACILDGPRLATAAPSSGHTLMADTQRADAAMSDGGDICLLGEGDGCHCACAHATALPAVAVALATVVNAAVTVSHWPETFSPPMARLALRPPIA